MELISIGLEVVSLDVKEFYIFEKSVCVVELTNLKGKFQLAKWIVISK